MSTLIINGWNQLHGCIRVWGAKNASYKLMIASLLGTKASRLLNIPDIHDVQLVEKVITLLGGEVKHVGNKTISLDPNISSRSIPQEFWEKSRASAVFLWPLLAKFGHAEIPLPGWDKLWKRPLDRLMDWFESMWVQREMKGERLCMSAPDGLKWCTYRFHKNTHTWTEVMLMASVLAKGKTILENAAEEPEIDDMISFLNKMWAKIRRRAFRTIEIDGVDELEGAIHSVIPDRNTVVTYACAALISRGDIIIENAEHEHLTAFLDKLDEAWWWYEIGDFGIRFYYKWPLRATDITTLPHPWFMTDWQALRAVLMCTATWDSTIHETIFPYRFTHYQEVLEVMWASFTTFAPEVQNPEKVYNFNRDETMVWWNYALTVHGPVSFGWWEFHLNDLRAWATAILAWLVGSGKTVLYNVEQVYRWYENIDTKLRQLGADIVLVD